MGYMKQAVQRVKQVFDHLPKLVLLDNSIVSLTKVRDLGLDSHPSIS